VDVSYKKISVRLSIHGLVLYFLNFLKNYIYEKLGLTRVMSSHPSFKSTRQVIQI
jgi:hypothetical protein